MIYRYNRSQTRNGRNEQTTMKLVRGHFGSIPINPSNRSKRTKINTCGPRIGNFKTKLSLNLRANTHCNTYWRSGAVLLVYGRVYARYTHRRIKLYRAPQHLFAPDDHPTHKFGLECSSSLAAHVLLRSSIVSLPPPQEAYHHHR